MNSVVRFYIVFILLFNFQIAAYFRLNMFRKCMLRPMHGTLSSVRLFSGKLFRLERILANRGLGSRSEVAILFRQGKVSVNGRVVRSGADKYPLSVEVAIDGNLSKESPFLLGIYKPLGMHCTLSDPMQRRCLKELYDEPSDVDGYHPVGRLDADTTGLLLFSRNGVLSERLLSPDIAIEREYEAIVTGIVDFEKLSEILANGVKTTLGTFPAKLISSIVLDKELSKECVNKLANQSALLQLRQNDALLQFQMKYMTESLNANKNNAIDEELKISVIRVVVWEGKHRMVRRLLHNSGHSVLALHRKRFGPFSLSVNQLPDANCDDTWKEAIVQMISTDTWPVPALVRNSAVVLSHVQEHEKKSNTSEDTITQNKPIIMSSNISTDLWIRELLKSAKSPAMSAKPVSVQQQIKPTAPKTTPVKEKASFTIVNPTPRAFSVKPEKKEENFENKLLEVFGTKLKDVKSNDNQ